MQEGIDLDQWKGDQEMACCGAQRGHKIVDKAKKWCESIQECVMRRENRKPTTMTTKEGNLWERETKAWKVNTLFPHWPGRYSTLTLFWIRRVYQGCWSEGSRRRRAAVGSSGQDRESDKDKTRQGKTHYSPTAKETKTVPVGVLEDHIDWRDSFHTQQKRTGITDARTRVVRVIDRHSGSQELQNHSVKPASDSTDQHDRAVWTTPLHRSGLRDDSRSDQLYRLMFSNACGNQGNSHFLVVFEE